MSLPIYIKDGEGSSVKAGVTSAHALKVAIVAMRLETLSPEELAGLAGKTQLRTYLRLEGEGAGSNDLNVDGSTTPQLFWKGSETNAALFITSARILMNGTNLEINTNDFRRFGDAAVAPGLTDGIEFYFEQSGEQTDLFIEPIQTIGDFLNFADDFTNLVNSIGSQEDFLSFDFVFDQPVVLTPGSVDRIVMKISDDLTDIDLLKVIVRGWQETA